MLDHGLIVSVRINDNHTERWNNECPKFCITEGGGLLVCVFLLIACSIDNTDWVII